MTNRGLINEVFWLRCIACLAVTFGHAIQSGYHHFNDQSYYQAVSYVLYMAVLFGVPVFVFISEFLLSNKYAKKTPKGFLAKRIKILLFPYLFMSMVYALFETEVRTLEGVLLETVKNVFLGASTVYFILIIFQFYLLHLLLSKHLDRLSPKVVLPAAFTVNFIYLAFFNFVEAPAHPVGAYIWNPGYWMPFIGWIFYFCLGYYCGKYYTDVVKLLHRYSKLVLSLPLVMLALVLMLDQMVVIDHSSKRIDMLLFASSMIFFILYVSSVINKLPGIVLLISNYSFSIFLLNEVFFSLFLLLEPPAYLNILSYASLAFVLSLVASISMSYLFNRLPFGQYLVGQKMKFRLNETKSGMEKPKMLKEV